MIPNSAPFGCTTFVPGDAADGPIVLIHKLLARGSSGGANTFGQDDGLGIRVDLAPVGTGTQNRGRRGRRWKEDGANLPGLERRFPVVGQTVGLGETVHKSIAIEVGTAIDIDRN